MQRHFPNLNSIRCIGAFLVLYSHFEQNKDFLKMQNQYDNVYCKLAATIGLNSFFVLSGFLISYLLLDELNKFHTISFKSFYLKRVLRIWPLYYFIVFLALVVFPLVPFFEIPYYSAVFKKHWLLSVPFMILIIPNLASSIIGVIPFATQAWSIGSEEQFYLFWPLFVYKFSKVFVKASLFLLIFFLASSLSLEIGKGWIEAHCSPIMYRIYDCLQSFYASSRISIFCIGGLGAYLFHRNHKIMSIVYHPITQVVSLFVLLLCICIQIYPYYLVNEFYSIPIAILLVNMATNSHSIINLENPVFDYLGRISYGLYMYHNIALFTVLKVSTRILDVTEISWQANILMFFISCLLTTLLSHISYVYLESKILKLRSKIIPNSSRKP